MDASAVSDKQLHTTGIADYVGFLLPSLPNLQRLMTYRAGKNGLSAKPSHPFHPVTPMARGLYSQIKCNPGFWKIVVTCE
jgi:hypothetical protein